MTINLERKKKGQTQGRTNRRMPICNPTIQLVVVDLYTKNEVSILNGCGDIFDEKVLRNYGRTDGRTDGTTDRCKPVYPPLFQSGGIIIYTDGYDKANILNSYFQSQTLLDEQNAVLPNLPGINRLNSHLDNIVFTKLEVESVLKTLVVGKASGPNGVSHRILRE